MIATRVAMKAAQCAVSAVALTVVALLTVGCTGFNNPISPDTTPMGGVMIQGVVHGGQQPISGATLGLYVAGSTGYGSSGGSNLLGVTPLTTSDGTSTSDGNANAGNTNNTLPLGNFVITGDFTCPSGTSLVYLTATGGDAGSGSNSAIQLVAALGQCGTLNSGTFININEVTTAAAALALGQFASPASDNIGTSATNSTGLINAFNTVNSLVTISTGAAVTSSTLTGAGGTVTATPESAKLYTIANILASCVNSSGPSSTACTTLFPDVTPTSATAPTDTFQAAVYMSQNPTSNNASTSPTNLAALYALQTGTSPFTGSGSQLTDWTVGIQYTDATTSLLDPQNIAADASGNIWVLNDNTSGTNDGSLTELNPTGTPQLNVTTINSVNIGALKPRNMALDTNGNAWITATQTTPSVFEYNEASPSSSIAFADSNLPYGIAIDGNNNIFVTDTLTASATTSVEEFLGGNLASTSQVEYGVASFSSTTQQPQYAAIDTSGNLWMTNGSAITGNFFQMSGFNGATGGVCTVFPCNVGSDSSLTQTYTNMVSATSGVPSLSEPFGITAGASGVVWTANAVKAASPAGSSTVSRMTSTTAGTDYGSYGSGTGSNGSFSQPEYVAVDGAGNLWAANKGTGAVSELSKTGTVLSPVQGTSPFNTIGFKHSGIAGAQGIAIDLSGNVWIANNTLNTGGVFEMVGAGAPTDTPIAKSLADSKVGVEP